MHRKNLNRWAEKHLAGLFIFNLVVLLMVLLNTAGYFKPFFFLNINAITFISLVLAIFLLGVADKTMFAIAIIFFLIASFFKIIGITIWADRSMIYTYQSLVLGFILLSKNILLKNNLGGEKKHKR